MSNNNTIHNSAHIDIDMHGPPGCLLQSRSRGKDSDYQPPVIHNISGEFYVFWWVQYINISFIYKYIFIHHTSLSFVIYNWIDFYHYLFVLVSNWYIMIFKKNFIIFLLIIPLNLQCQDLIQFWILTSHYKLNLSQLFTFVYDLVLDLNDHLYSQIIWIVHHFF